MLLSTSASHAGAPLSQNAGRAVSHRSRHVPVLPWTSQRFPHRPEFRLQAGAFDSVGRVRRGEGVIRTGTHLTTDGAKMGSWPHPPTLET